MSKWHSLYGSRWQKARLSYLKSNPLCVMCAKDGMPKEATVVDHIKPHKGDLELFWNVLNWQPLCKHHHDSHKQRIENRGHEFGCDEFGNPIDANHHWNK